MVSIGSTMESLYGSPFGRLQAEKYWDRGSRIEDIATRCCRFIVVFYYVGPHFVQLIQLVLGKFLLGSL